jgi:hypothetical protein
MVLRLHKSLPIAGFICWLIALPFLSGAQGYYFYDNGHYEPSWVLDLSGNFGIVNPVMDVGGSKKEQTGLKPYIMRNKKFTGGISLTATHKDWVAIRLDLNVGRVEAHDSLLKGATHYSSIGRFERNLNFRSNIFQAMVGFELHPVFLRDYQIYDRYMPRISPFIVAGIGVVAFRPQALVGTEWIDLEPLRLEGQGFEEYPDRKPYSRVAMTLPVGFGLRYELSRTFTLRAELLHNFTNTDYIDDVSQGDWIDPALFNKYFDPAKAALATQLYNRSVIVNPPRNTRPRGDDTDNDIFWSIKFGVGVALNREKKTPKAYHRGVRSNSFRGRGLQLH